MNTNNSNLHSSIDEINLDIEHIVIQAKIEAQTNLYLDDKFAEVS